MTKMKSKKMTKSTFAIIIMAIAMVAMLAFGGTYAYFTASAEAGTKTLTMGIIDLGESTVTIAESVKDVLPGEKIETVTLSVTDKSNRASYIFVTVTGSLTKKDAAEGESLNVPIELTAGTTLKSAEVTPEEGDTYTVWYVETEDYTDNTTTGAAVEFTTSITLSTEIGDEYQGGTLTITLSAESIQQESFNSVADAYLALQGQKAAA